MRLWNDREDAGKRGREERTLRYGPRRVYLPRRYFRGMINLFSFLSFDYTIGATLEMTR